MYIFRPRATNYSSSGYKNSNKRPWVICIQATHVLVAAGQDISETGFSRDRDLTGQGSHGTGFSRDRDLTGQGSHGTGISRGRVLTGQETGARFLGERAGIRGGAFSRERDRFRWEWDF